MRVWQCCKLDDLFQFFDIYWHGTCNVELERVYQSIHFFFLLFDRSH